MMAIASTSMQRAIRERTGALGPVIAVLSALTALAVVMPIVSIVTLAVEPAPDLWSHLITYVLPAALVDTATLLAGVAVLTLVFGAGSAWIVSVYDFPGRTLFVGLLPLPLAIPTYISAYVYVEVFEPLGVVQRLIEWLGLMANASASMPAVRSLPGAIAVMSFVLYPYVYLAARTMFQVQSAELVEVARGLGARRFAILRRVSWPMARPAIAVGLALALLETLNDFGASDYLGVRTLTVSIFTTWLNRGSLAGAAQIACLMLVVVSALVLLERYGRRGRVYATSAESPRMAQRLQLRGAKAATATLACLVPLTLGFVIPLAFLAYEVIKRRDTVFDPMLVRDTLNTVSLAGTATLIVLVLGLATAAATRWWRHGVFRFFAAVSGLGYALPGTVLALGLLTPLVRIDEAINWLVRAFGGAGPGLVLAGSGAAIVAAYVIRFVAVAAGFSQAGLVRIPTEYDDSARVVGARQAAVLRRIYLPLLQPALWGAAIIVFVDCLKELPATLLLRPLNVETLSTSIYQYASRGSFEQGSLAALLIVAAGIGPVIWLARFADVAQDVETTVPQELGKAEHDE
jgi:iron(III) transport system permease protein